MSLTTLIHRVSSGIKLPDRRPLHEWAETCDWKENETHGYWEGTCGMVWEFTTGTPETNGFLYCPRCGRRVHTANGKFCRHADSGRGAQKGL